MTQRPSQSKKYMVKISLFTRKHLLQNNLRQNSHEISSLTDSWIKELACLMLICLKKKVDTSPIVIYSDNLAIEKLEILLSS